MKINKAKYFKVLWIIAVALFLFDIGRHIAQSNWPRMIDNIIGLMWCCFARLAVDNSTVAQEVIVLQKDLIKQLKETIDIMGVTLKKMITTKDKVTDNLN